VAAPELARARSFDLAAWLEAQHASADRAGLLLCGDVGAALQVLLREDASGPPPKLETTEALVQAARRRRDLAEVLAFVLSDDHFKLRGRLRLTVG